MHSIHIRLCARYSIAQGVVLGRLLSNTSTRQNDVTSAEGVEDKG